MKNMYRRLSCATSALIILLFLSVNSSAQSLSAGKTVSPKLGFGFRAGLNFAKVSGNSDSLQYDYKPGFMVAVFLTPPHTGIVGYRSELLYSRQGFKYSDNKGNDGSVTNDYIMLPQMMTINITRFVQLQAGAFAGYLLRTKNSAAAGNEESDNNNYLKLMNRLDYGAGGGIEIHPIKGLMINARYNIGFAKLYKEQTDFNPNLFSGSLFPFGNIDTKNAVIQLSLGYQF